MNLFKKLPQNTHGAIAIAALSLISLPSVAQQTFDFGLKGLITSSSLVNANDYAAGNELNLKDRMGIGGGVGAGYSFTKHVGVEIDVLYAQEGSAYTGDATLIKSPGDDKNLSPEFQGLAQYNGHPISGSYNADVYLNYMKIPIMFRYNMAYTKKVFFSLLAGPQFDFLSSATIKVNGSTMSFPGGASTKSAYQSSGTDGVLGLGLGINATENILITAYLRFDYGFGDAENKNATITENGTSSDIYNSKRAVTNNATGGGFIGVSYKLHKKHVDAKKKMTETSDEDTDQKKDQPDDQPVSPQSPNNPATNPTSPR